MYFAAKKSVLKKCPYKFMDVSNYGRDYCDGADCAMWRWKPELNPDWKPEAPALYESQGDYRKKPPPYIDSKTLGYCGLAVRPNLG